MSEEALRLYKLLTQTRGQEIARLGKRIHGQRTRIQNLTQTNHSLRRINQTMEQAAESDMHALAGMRVQLERALRENNKLKERLLFLEALHEGKV